MTNNETIDKLINIKSYLTAGNPIWDVGTIREVMDMAIEALKQTQWVPVSERLPEADGKYLCCWQGKSIETGMFLNHHFRLYGEIKDSLITAWMPLPEPARLEDT